MAVCFFNSNYEGKYSCTYEVCSDYIKIDVDYDIGQEIETKDGVRFFSSETTFTNRDILIVDAALKNYYLVKNAQYNGMSNRYGTLDSQDIASFISKTYFKADSVNKLRDLLSNPKIKRIRIYSKAIAEYIHHPSVIISNSQEERAIVLSKRKSAKAIEINANNIRKISIADEWSEINNCFSINIQMKGYIELELFRRVDYLNVSEYVYEVIMFLQLFRPSKFEIDNITVKVDDYYYEFFASLRKPQYTKRYVQYSTNIELLVFLKQCYIKIPYRSSKDVIRNIPYVVLNTYRDIEDNFLMFYRFIERFYKQQNITRSIETGIQDHLKDYNKHVTINTENEVQEIVCLRNHYVHSGYYIKNESLRISFDKKKKDYRDYTVKVNFDWLYKKTKELYLIVIDIIFVDMLEIKEYFFDRMI